MGRPTGGAVGSLGGARCSYEGRLFYTKYGRYKI
jgi:hypothetical protein